MKNLFGKITSKAMGFALNRKIECPGCQKMVFPQVHHDAEGGIADVVCPDCGDRSDVETWLGQMRDRLEPLAIKPEPCGIEESYHQGEYRWQISGSKRPNFFWFFALFWNGIAWSMTALMGYGMFFGTPTQDVKNQPWLLWAMPLFMLPFLAVGIGVLYAALATSFQQMIFVVGLRDITITKNLFGWKRTKSFPKSEICDALLASAYQKNHKPVYGIQLMRRAGKAISLGISRPHQEKRWLLHQLRKALSLECVEAAVERDSAAVGSSSMPAYESSFLTVTPRLDGFTFTSKSSLGAVLLALGAGFFVIGCVFVVMISREAMPLFPFAFVSPVGMVIGLAMFGYGLVSKKTTHHYALLADQASVEIRRSGETVKTRRFMRSDFAKVDMREVGQVNGQSRYTVTLKGKKVWKLCSFMPHDDAEALALRASQWLAQGGSNVLR